MEDDAMTDVSAPVLFGVAGYHGSTAIPGVRNLLAAEGCTCHRNLIVERVRYADASWLRPVHRPRCPYLTHRPAMVAP
jgi:hypothetical protein